MRDCGHNFSLSCTRMIIRIRELSSRVLTYLTSHYPEPNYHFQNKLEKIGYYTTKYLVSLPNDISVLMDNILRYENNNNPILDVDQFELQISVIKFDITQIKTDAIINAANADGLGCFEYGHKCIDNVIHSKAGPQIQIECNSILNGKKIETSGAIITKGYNLSSKYVLHTVGPIYDKKNHDLCCKQLSQCYINCMQIAIKHNLKSIVFCCISTG